MIFSSQLKKLDGLSTEESLKAVSNHLRKMQEELEYRLSVLDSSNISEIDTDLTNVFTKGKNINNIISDQEGKTSQLQQSVDGFSVKISEYEKGYSEWKQTVDGFTATVSNYETKISLWQQTVDGFTSQVSNYEKGYSAWQQTVDGFTAQVKDYETGYSTWSQTVDGFKTQVSKYESAVTSYQQTVDNFTWTVQNLQENLGTMLKLDASGLYIIDQNGNYVTISGSQIDASTINASQIKVNNLYGSEIYLKSQYGNYYYDAGKFSVTGASTADFAIDLRSFGALRLTAEVGDLYLGAKGYVTLGGSNADCASNFRPSGDNAYTLGASYAKWKDIYGQNSAINTSDRELKTDITYGLDEYEETFKRLRPVSYRFKDGTTGRKHTGFISQDVEEDLEAGGLTDMDFAGFIKSPRVDKDGKEIEGEYDYALRYGEFIALNTHMIQKLMRRTEKLERRVAELESQ